MKYMLIVASLGLAGCASIPREHVLVCFVSMLTDEEIAQAKIESCQFGDDLYDVARANQVDVPTICYYA